MREKKQSKIYEIMARVYNKKPWNRGVTAVAAVIVFITTYLLILPAITMTRDLICDKEEHLHSESCYETTYRRVLTCPYGEPAEGRIILHHHDENCYDANGNLVCPLPEIEGHTHTAACFGETEDLFGSLPSEEAFGAPDGFGSADGFSSAGGEDLFSSAAVLPDCGKDEFTEHIHTAECYDFFGNLICGKQEVFSHQHGEECFSFEEDQKFLICGKEEHIHDDSCYRKKNEDADQPVGDAEDLFTGEAAEAGFAAESGYEAGAGYEAESGLTQTDIPQADESFEMSDNSQTDESLLPADDPQADESRLPGDYPQTGENFDLADSSADANFSVDLDEILAETQEELFGSVPEVSLDSVSTNETDASDEALFGSDYEEEKDQSEEAAFGSEIQETTQLETEDEFSPAVSFFIGGEGDEDLFEMAVDTDVFSSGEAGENQLPSEITETTTIFENAEGLTAAETTTEATTEEYTGQTTEQNIIEGSTERTTESVSVEDGIEQTTESVSAEDSTEQTTESVSAEGSTEQTTEWISAENLTEQTTEWTSVEGGSEETTEWIPAEGSVEETIELTSADNATEQITEWVSVENSTEQTTEWISVERSTEQTTEWISVERSTEQTTDWVSAESSTEQTSEWVLFEESTEQTTEWIFTENSTEQTTVWTTFESTTEQTTEWTTRETSTESTTEWFETTTTYSQPTPSVLEYIGQGYKVRLTYLPSSGIPDGARLEAEEIAHDSEEYKEYLSQAKEALGLSENMELPKEYARFFDIRIMVLKEKETGDGEAETSEISETSENIEDVSKQSADAEEDYEEEWEEIEPAGPVRVEILYDEPVKIEGSDTASANVIHFNEEETKVEVLATVDVSANRTDTDEETADSEEGEKTTENSNETSEPNGRVVETEIALSHELGEESNIKVTFDTESFSVYGVIYTVDFNWEVDGKQYQLSLPGGGFVSFEALMEIMGVADKDSKADGQIKTSGNQADAGTEVIQTNGMLTVNDISISEETKAFIRDVENVIFSNPELVWVGKVGLDSTVGGLKEANGLKCQYSAVLTEEQITEINAQTVKTGDWALISVQPFRSEETLTVIMKNGDQFVVNVTDAQDPSAYLDKEVIIYDNDGQRAMLSGGYIYAKNYRFNSIPLSEAEGNEAAHWTVERHNNNYYLKSSDNRYLTIDSNNVGLVNNWSVATPLTIQAGSNSDYRIYAANNGNNVLSYSTNTGWGDGYFSAPGGKNGTTNREWLYIREIEAVYNRTGDWLLYFDDDFSEITIHVGETISLRPYNKWEWKEGNVNVQTAHWNIDGRNNNYWNQIDINDANGAHKETWDNGGTGNTAGFHWTAYVKKDDQLDTHYWAVQGQATQTGDYVLKNTNNGKTITVHVVDGIPEPPKTINKIANIKVNLFDYDNGGELDVGLVNGETNKNLANNSNFKSESVNQMGGSNHFYFLSSGSGNNNDESWNSYTKDNPNPQIVKNALGTDGYPVLNHDNNTSLKYLFDTSQASQSWHGGSGSDGMIAYPDVVGMFQKDNDGYYYFNSNTNYFYYNTATGTSKLYEHTYTQNSSASKGALANDKPIGFFPFHDYDSKNDLYVNQNAALNHHIGLSMELEFMLPRDKKDDKGNDIIFDFSGDDDLWVFVEWVDNNGQKQSKLLLDLGGVHQPIHGDINFTSGSNTAFMETNRPYTLKVFYLERGGCDSNCSIRFNLPIIQDLTVAKKLTGLTEEEKAKYKDEEFTYEIVVNGQPYNYPNPNNRYEKAVIRNVAGEDITPANFTITNGRVKIKDGQTLTITYLDRNDKFSVAELKTPNMENFEVPNAELYYHQEHDTSLYEKEIDLIVSQTLSEPHTADWVTPTYELEDTEKVTFTNTLKEKNLEVEKKWKGEKDHPDSITFTVSATVDDGQGGRIPYAVKELKEDDGTTDKVFTLNDANHWRYEIEHLPVNTPATTDVPEGKFIFYDINEGHVEGYTLTGLKDITAENYNYCNVDVVKLWPESNGIHTEVLKVILKNSEGKYYAGVKDDGEAIFSADQELASVYELKPDNNYTHRFARLPAGEYTVVQLNEDEYSKGLATYIRNIIQYELENSPLDSPVDPSDKPNAPEIHKRIDALRDGVTNPDSAHANEDLTDLYRLYLDYKVKSLQEANGVDLLFVIDHSGSMNNSAWQGNPYRAPAVEAALNGNNGLISEFLAMNDKNQWAAVGFKGPDGARNYTWSIGNPWYPYTQTSAYDAGLNGSEVLSPGGESYVFTRTDVSPGKNVTLANEGANILTNYTAGLWRAEQFLLKQDVKEDGRKKVVVFISDGIPTLHIDCPNGTLQGAGAANGSPYYRDAYGGCPTQTLTEFGYFVNDITTNGYKFGENMEFYTIGFGGTMQTESGSQLLNGMLDIAYGEDGHDGHFMTITDTNNSNPQAPAEKLKNDLRTIMGMNETFSNIVIQDDLSTYVDLYGLAGAGTNASSIMSAAKAKVTMKIPDSNASSGTRIITLYENGTPVNSDDAKFTRADGVTKANIIQSLKYAADTKTVKAVFDPEYQALEGVIYTLSFDVKTTDQAYAKYAADGYDKYTEGEKQGQIITGDIDTDFFGTDPDNATSVGKEGFRSNDEAKATYNHNGKNEEEKYPHPVIQVAAKVDIVKIDQTGAALEGAKFNLYDNRYDASKTIAENAAYLIEADLQSKKPADPAGEDAVIRSGKLTAGTYYLVETKTLDGYILLPDPVKITVTEESGVLTLTAEIAGEYIGADKLEKINKGLWKLRLQNSAGYELPHTGGIGTKQIYLLGILITGLAAAGLVMRKRKRAA